MFNSKISFQKWFLILITKKKRFDVMNISIPKDVFTTIIVLAPLLLFLIQNLFKYISEKERGFFNCKAFKYVYVFIKREYYIYIFVCVSKRTSNILPRFSLITFNPMCYTGRQPPDRLKLP